MHYPCLRLLNIHRLRLLNVHRLRLLNINRLWLLNIHRLRRRGVHRLGRHIRLRIIVSLLIRHSRRSAAHFIVEN